MRMWPEAQDPVTEVPLDQFASSGLGSGRWHASCALAHLIALF